jgi:D-glycero-alpha-D-manno-heptose-7-phosphate kinase
MLVIKSPLRISLLGGGTDFPDFFRSVPSEVLGFTINKYVYTNFLDLPDFAEEYIRFTYRLTESVQSIDEILHPSFREALRILNWKKRISVATMADVPGSSGLGSSSSFLISVLAGLQLQNDPSHKLQPLELAMKAITIERDILKEVGGWQDQFHAAFGGFRSYRFSDEAVTVSEQYFSPSLLSEFSQSLFLVWIGATRHKSPANSSNHELSNTEVYAEREKLNTITAQTINTLSDVNTSEDLLCLIAEKFAIVRELKKKIVGTTSKAEEMIDICLKSGARAAKTCGAEGGGFIFVVGDSTTRQKISNLVPTGHVIPIEITSKGVDRLY